MNRSRNTSSRGRWNPRSGRYEHANWPLPDSICATLAFTMPTFLVSLSLGSLVPIIVYATISTASCDVSPFGTSPLVADQTLPCRSIVLVQMGLLLLPILLLLYIVQSALGGQEPFFSVSSFASRIELYGNALQATKRFLDKAMTDDGFERIPFPAIVPPSQLSHDQLNNNYSQAPHPGVQPQPPSQQNQPNMSSMSSFSRRSSASASGSSRSSRESEASNGQIHRVPTSNGEWERTTVGTESSYQSISSAPSLSTSQPLLPPPQPATSSQPPLNLSTAIASTSFSVGGLHQASTLPHLSSNPLFSLAASQDRPQPFIVNPGALTPTDAECRALKHAQTTVVQAAKFRLLCNSILCAVVITAITLQCFYTSRILTAKCACTVSCITSLAYSCIDRL